MKTVVILFWVGELVAVLIAAMILIVGMGSANTAPQEAVVCALALAVAVLPYCFVRALHEIFNVIKEK